ncbi:hypothetical protein GCM10017322_34690 [Paracoccus aerius]|nr:hypothetical protein GCM10017322_34690 [Paracoccus aerius]
MQSRIRIIRTMNGTKAPMLAKLEVPMRPTKSVPMEIMIEKIEAMNRGLEGPADAG